jgi:RNA recognition motif-containing protein
MSMKLFVGGLSWDTTDDSLRQAFSAHGSVIEARVMTDRETGRSRGFGFVGFLNPGEGASAQQAMDGSSLDGRTIRVNEAEDKAGGPRGGARRP